jgi:hypothetical protein
VGLRKAFPHRKVVLLEEEEEEEEEEEGEEGVEVGGVRF